MGARLSAQYDASSNPRGPLSQQHTTPNAPQQRMLIKAKIVLEDGAALNVAPQIVIADVPGACRVAEVFRDGTVTLYSASQPMDFRNPRPIACNIWKISLPGYEDVSGWVRNGSVIVMHRLGEHEGASVSVTTLKAPAEAQEAYGKGEALMAKQKWAKAQSYFEKSGARAV